MDECATTAGSSYAPMIMIKELVKAQPDQHIVIHYLIRI